MSNVRSFAIGAYLHREKPEDIMRQVEAFTPQDWATYGPDLGRRSIEAVARMHAADDEMYRACCQPSE